MLFEPLKIGTSTIRNRVCMPPMCTYNTKDGWVTLFHQIHYGGVINYGLGMQIVEATAVAPDGRISSKDLGIWDDSFIDGHKKLVDYAHEHKVYIAIQLGHAGRKAANDLRKIAPSAIRFSEDYDVPNEATLLEIKEVVKQFQAAALRAKKAGYDAVELHSAHGYLLNEFLSPITNKRTDEYGGTKENRKRLLFEVLDAVKEVFDRDIMVRLSCEEYLPEGNHIEFYQELAVELEQKGVVMIDVSSGGVAPVEMHAEPLYQVPLSRAIKEKVSIPVSAVGLITSYEQAEQILQEGSADLIQLGRELLRKPSTVRDWAVKIEEPLDIPSPYNNYRLK